MPSNFALSCIYRSLTTTASPSSIGAKKANKAISMTSEQRSWHERDSLMMPTGTELSHTCQRLFGIGIDLTWTSLYKEESSAVE